MPPKKIGSSKPVTRRRRSKRTATLQRIHLHDLPPELISEIFLSYHRITQASIVLLFVCRHWHDIALSISALWSTIRFQIWRSDQVIPSIKQTMHWPPNCLSWSQLERAANRAGRAKLNITADLDMFDNRMDANTEARSWLSTRCRSLRISVRSGSMENFVNSFRQMAALEELSLKGSDRKMDNISGRILENAEIESPRLVELQIEGHFPNKLTNRHTLLRRLRKLSLSYVLQVMNEHIYAGMISLLINLEELTWSFNLPPPPKLQLISGKLRSLTIKGSQTLPAIPFTQLTSLTLTCAVSAIAADQEVVELPCLKDLIFTGYWRGFILLRAPLLVDLQFECRDLMHAKELTPSPGIRPRSLAIIDLINETAKENLIQLLGGIWSEVEEIHWVYPWVQSIDLGRSLTKALSGTDRNEPLCPRLRQLTMKTDDPRSLKRPMIDQAQSGLRAIAQERQRRGKALHSIRWRWNKSTYVPGISTGLGDLGEDSFSIL